MLSVNADGCIVNTALNS